MLPFALQKADVGVQLNWLGQREAFGCIFHSEFATSSGGWVFFQYLLVCPKGYEMGRHFFFTDPSSNSSSVLGGGLVSREERVFHLVWMSQCN